jgi:hypothetical protein
MFVTVSCKIPLRMRNVLDKSCREKQNTHFMFNNFFSENRTIYENVEKWGGVRGARNDLI